MGSPEKFGSTSRRRMMIATAIGIGLYLSTPSEILDPKGKETKRMLDLLQAHTIAKVKPLGRVPPDDTSVFVMNRRDGAPLATTLRFMDDKGAIAQLTEQNREHAQELSDSFFEREQPADDIVPSIGSGFITLHNGSAYLISNRHLTDDTAQEIENLITMHPTHDVAAVPGELLRQPKDDPYKFRPVAISSMSNADLNGRTVSIQGMGTRLLAIEGPALRINETPDDPAFVDFKDTFALAIRTKDMKPHEAAGLSGSCVKDVKSGQAVGVFCGVGQVQGVTDRYFMFFVGLKELDEVLEQAGRNRMRDQARYNLNQRLDDVKARLRKTIPGDKPAKN